MKLRIGFMFLVLLGLTIFIAWSATEPNPYMKIVRPSSRMSDHKYSIALLALAAIFYVTFDIVIPELMYSDPQMQTQGGAQAVKGVGEILMKITPGLSLIMAALAVLLFFRERRD